MLAFFLLAFICPSLCQWEMLQSNGDLFSSWGTQFVFSQTNNPGSRFSPIMFSGNDTRYIFLGYGMQSITGFYDDLWVYDRTISMWAWLTGSSSVFSSSIALTGDLSHPSARTAANIWTDSNYNLWLYGGHFNLPASADFMADLWKLEIQDGYNVTWTYITGGDVEHPTTSIHASYEGDNQYPGSRGEAVTWIDASDNLYMFGGEGYGNYNPASSGQCADLWVFSTKQLKWTYLGGPQTTNVANQDYEYGTMGVASTLNWPKSSIFGTSWLIGDAFYMFGGQYGSSVYMSELWKWQNSTWTWLDGPQTTNATFLGSYGPLGHWSVQSLISGRSMGISWQRDNKEIWVIGGLGFTVDTHIESELADIWVYDLERKQWAWVYPDGSASITARCRCGYVFIGQELFVYGGYRITDTSYLGDMWRLDLTYFGDITEFSASQRKSNSVNVAAIVAPVVIVTALIILGIFLFLYKRKKRPTEVTSEKINDVPMETVVVPETELMQGVTVDNLIGSGNFGEVYKGTWQKTAVALKKIKKEFLSQFQKEFSVLVNLKHPQIVQYLGIYVDDDPYIVMELMSSGNLQSLFKVKEFSEKDLLKMSLDAASALVYLHDNNLIHRDIALRNYLASELGNGKIVIKLSDFGMSTMMSDTYYQSDNKVLPYKWASPEVLKFGKYSTASDVWAFGITLWEIYSLGATPYPGKDNVETSEFVLSGKRMQKPEKCPQVVFEIVTLCWEEKTKARPTMREVHESLKQSWKNLYEEEKSKSEYYNEAEDGVYGLTIDPQMNYETRKKEDVEYSSNTIIYN